MGSFFKLANKEDVVRYETPDGEDFISFREQLSKGEWKRIIKKAPVKQGEEEVSIEQALGYQDLFFMSLAVEWSVLDDEGNKTTPSIELFDALPTSAAEWIEEKLKIEIEKHFGKHVKRLEEKSDS